MRDEHPLSIFTLQNAVYLAENGSGSDSFLYVTIYSLWREALLNKHLATNMRLFMLEVVYHLMLECYADIFATEAARSITEKVTRSSKSVTFAARGNPNRANLGGVRLTDDGYSANPGVSALQFAESLLRGLRFPVRFPDMPGLLSIGDAIQWLIDIAVYAPCGPVRVHGQISGVQILSRLIAFSGEAVIPHEPARRTRVWTLPELRAIEVAIEGGEHDPANLADMLPTKSATMIQKEFRRILKDTSARRPWMPEEDAHILGWVQEHGRKWPQAEGDFIARTHQDIRARYYVLVGQWRSGQRN